MPIKNFKSPPIAVGYDEGQRIVADAETFENFAVHYGMYVRDNKKKDREKLQMNYLRRSPRIAKKRLSVQDWKPVRPRASKFRRLSSVISESNPGAVIPVMQLTELKRKRKCELESLIAKKAKFEELANQRAKLEEESETALDKNYNSEAPVGGNQKAKKPVEIPKRALRGQCIEKSPESPNQELVEPTTSSAKPKKSIEKPNRNRNRKDVEQKPEKLQTQTTKKLPESRIQELDVAIENLEQLVEMVNENQEESPESPIPTIDNGEQPMEMVSDVLQDSPASPDQELEETIVSPESDEQPMEMVNHNETLQTPVEGLNPDFGGMNSTSQIEGEDDDPVIFVEPVEPASELLEPIPRGEDEPQVKPDIVTISESNSEVENNVEFEMVQIRQEAITPESDHPDESYPNSRNPTPTPTPTPPTGENKNYAQFFMNHHFSGARFPHQMPNHGLGPQSQHPHPRVFHDYAFFPSNPIPPPVYPSMRAPSLTPESPIYSPVPEMPQISQRAYNCCIELHNLHPTAVQGGKFMLTGEVTMSFGGTSVTATTSFMFHSDVELANFEHHYFGQPVYSYYLLSCDRNFNFSSFSQAPRNASPRFQMPGQPLQFPPVQLPSWFNPNRMPRHESRPVPPPMPHQFPTHPEVVPPSRQPRQPTMQQAGQQPPTPQPPPWFQANPASPRTSNQHIFPQQGAHSVRSSPPPVGHQTMPPSWLHNNRATQQEPRPTPQDFNVYAPHSHPSVRDPMMQQATTTSADEEFSSSFNFRRNPHEPTEMPMPGMVPKPEEVYYPEQSYHQHEPASPIVSMPEPEEESFIPNPETNFPNEQEPWENISRSENGRLITIAQVQLTIIRERYHIIEQPMEPEDSENPRVELPVTPEPDDDIIEIVEIDSSSDEEEEDKPLSSNFSPNHRTADALQALGTQHQLLVRRHLENEFVSNAAFEYSIFCLKPIIPELALYCRSRKFLFHLQDQIKINFVRQYFNPTFIRPLNIRLNNDVRNSLRHMQRNTANTKRERTRSIRLRTDLMGGPSSSGNENDCPPSNFQQNSYDQMPFVIEPDDENFDADPRTSINYIVDWNNLDKIGIVVHREDISLTHRNAYEFFFSIPNILRRKLMKPATIEEVP